MVDTKGQEPETKQYQVSTIAVNHSSEKIWVNHQVSLRAGETLQGKRLWEYDLAQYGFKVQTYHSDNGIFQSKEFQQDLKLRKQTIDFSGSGAHHHNGVAKQAIQNIVEWARTMILHAALHWPVESDLKLCPLAMDYAVHMWNNLPSQEHGLTPNEIISQTLVPNFNTIKCTHVWGCPIYVLEPKLQDSRKLPKWSRRAKRGQFLGFLKNILPK